MRSKCPHQSTNSHVLSVRIIKKMKNKKSAQESKGASYYRGEDDAFTRKIAFLLMHKQLCQRP